MKQIIIINIEGSSDKELETIQLELFKQGYRWANDGKKIEKYLSLHNPIVIIDQLIYTMDNNSIKYLSDDLDVRLIRVDSITTYFRHLKIKKIRKNEKFN